MRMPSFGDQAKAWSSPPVDHLNAYIPAQQLLDLSPAEFARTIERMAQERYGGWRNYGNRWVNMFHTGVAGKRALDYGCGVGLEAAMLGRAGATVDIADISELNLRVAARTMNLYVVAHGTAMYSIGPSRPFTQAPVGGYDIFYCNGVLHHIWYPIDVMVHAWDLLRPGGQARLMLYSDIGWRTFMGCDPPDDTPSHPLFRDFVRTFDQVGGYADWYSADKIKDWFGPWFELEQFEYLTPDQRYCGAVLRRRDRVA